MVYQATGCFVREDHVEIECRLAAGVGARMAWTVTVAGQSSVNPRTGYRAPFITRIAVMTPSGTATNDSTVMSTVDSSGASL